MYFIKNGKKVKYVPPIHQKPKDNFFPIVKETHNNVKKCPLWVFTVLGTMAVLITVWIVLSIIKDKNNKFNLSRINGS